MLQEYNGSFRIGSFPLLLLNKCFGTSLALIYGKINPLQNYYLFYAYDLI